MTLASKVYTAYTKFIEKQIIEKKKSVDSVYIGLFKANEHTSSAKLYPSQEFIEAGRFKLPIWIRDELREKKLGTDYQKLFGQIRAEVTSNNDCFITISTSSIAASCGTSAEMVN